MNVRSECPVCGDRVNGIHYGIYTCEGWAENLVLSILFSNKKKHSFRLLLSKNISDITRYVECAIKYTNSD